MDLKELKEAQGEGVGFAPDGALLLTSEGGKKKNPATFARLTCALD
jgi:glutamine cyclotransferase